MNSPITAQAWEIWQRGRRSALLVLGSLAVCALLNLVILDRFHLAESGQHMMRNIFGMLMALSFLLLMGIFNYTESNSAKDWNGFPYRLFALPVRTWQLVTLPLLISVVSLELLYVGWIKLVWTHTPFEKPEWFAILLGAYAIFYQTVLWSLAGLRITRMVVLGFGGVIGVGVACLPFFRTIFDLPWLSEKRLGPLLIGLALVSYVIAWASVSRQRSGGGRRRSWFKALVDKVSDVLPRRTRDFNSAAAAQFWFEWRRTGLLLPVSTAFVLLAIFGPVTWMFRTDEYFAVSAFWKILATPLVLSFAIGKDFTKPEFWALNLSVPSFLAVRPIASSEFVASKLKVAALSVALAWSLVVGFIVVWLSCWANTAQILYYRFLLQMLFPHYWPVLLTMSLAVFAVLTWRFLVNGLWTGLSGKRIYYFGAMALQVAVPVMVAIVCAIESANIDSFIKNNPDRASSLVFSAVGWLLAFAVIAKVWCAAFTWRKISPVHSRPYLLLWSGVTLGAVLFAILATQTMDTYRFEHLCVLAAFLLFPLARLGLAPGSFAKNRHR